MNVTLKIMWYHSSTNCRWTTLLQKSTIPAGCWPFWQWLSPSELPRQVSGRHCQIGALFLEEYNDSFQHTFVNQPAVVDTSIVCGSPKAALLEANPTTVFLSPPLVLVEYFFRSASKLAELKYGSLFEFFPCLLSNIRLWFSPDECCVALLYQTRFPSFLWGIGVQRTYC